MRSVLGIDAAWTVTQPSGIALAVNRSDGWQLAAVEPSYSDFEGLADSQIAVGRRPVGSTPEPSTLLKASSSLLRDGKVDLVAIDIPLARTPICGRRAADNAVSKVYGGKKKCGTHSPTKTRPGEISRVLQEGFAARGYPLLTQTAIPPGLIEVYPHPALLELAQEPERLPYKIAKVRNYWPSCSPDERRLRLFEQWTK